MEGSHSTLTGGKGGLGKVHAGTHSAQGTATQCHALGNVCSQQMPFKTDSHTEDQTVTVHCTCRVANSMDCVLSI